jgi:secreted PhoX family phosphatase
MKEDQGLGRRDFLKGAVVGGAAAATTTTGINLPQDAQAQQAPAIRSSISRRRPSSKRWSITWCPPTS